jgi:putative NADH-flavin reductase
MKITIFGATGGTGRHLAEQALAAGHDVTVVVRDPARLAVTAPATDLARAVSAGQTAASTASADSAGPASAGPASAGPASADFGSASRGGQPVAGGPGLRVLTADVMDPAAITGAMAGADAVLTAIGPRVSGPSTVSADSAASIIAAMRRTGVRRLLTVSGSIVDDAGEGPIMSHLVKPLARRTFLKNVCADMRRGEEVVRASGLDWTIMRPPRLTDKPATGRYRTALDRNLPRGLTVSRADLAACMLALIEDTDAVHHIVGIAD